MKVSLRDLEKRRYSLYQMRLPFEKVWLKIDDYISYNIAESLYTSSSAYRLINNKIMDSTPTNYLDRLVAGLMSGLTNESLIWFLLGHRDKELNESLEVRSFIHEASEILRHLFIQSNLYSTLPNVYRDTAAMGTGCMLMEEEEETGFFRFTHLPIGSYMISNNRRQEVDTIIREFTMTIRQVIEEFGKKNVPQLILDTANNGQEERHVEVCHYIAPNKYYDPNKIDARYKQYTSIYYLKGFDSGTPGQTPTPSIGADTGFLDAPPLRHTGLDYFPAVAIRWKLSGSYQNAYGTMAPGILSLPDAMQLMKLERKALRAIDKMIDPPLVGSYEMKNSRQNASLAGQISFLNNPDQGLKPTYQVAYDLQAAEMKQQQTRERMKETWYGNLLTPFLDQMEHKKTQRTATEATFANNEKPLFSPVYGSFKRDGLDPTISRSFYIAMKNGLLPEPPEELQGTSLDIQYLSVLALNEKLVGLENYDRSLQFLAMLDQSDPNNQVERAFDAIKKDEYASEYLRRLSIDPDAIRDKEEIAALRQERMQQIQQAQQAEQAKMQSESMRNLSQAKLEGEGEEGEARSMLDEAASEAEEDQAV